MFDRDDSDLHLQKVAPNAHRHRVCHVERRPTTTGYDVHGDRGCPPHAIRTGLVLRAVREGDAEERAFTWEVFGERCRDGGVWDGCAGPTKPDVHEVDAVDQKRELLHVHQHGQEACHGGWVHDAVLARDHEDAVLAAGDVRHHGDFCRVGGGDTRLVCAVLLPTVVTVTHRDLVAGGARPGTDREVAGDAVQEGARVPPADDLVLCVVLLLARRVAVEASVAARTRVELYTDHAALPALGACAVRAHGVPSADVGSKIDLL